MQSEELNMIERISSFFTSTIVIAVLAAVLTLLSICVLLRPVAASERPAGDAGSSVIAPTEPQRGFQAQARASAKASATAVSKSGPRGCRAESSTQAEARAGDDHDYQQDHDSKEQSGGGCRAEASSRATATSDDGSE